jgi:hypothetical protein
MSTEGTQEMGTLDIEQDLDYQDRAWKRQRVSWVVMALVLLGALLGFFGPGLLGNSTAGNKGDPLWLEYNRFGRLQAETTTLRVYLSQPAGTRGQIRFWLSRGYVEDVRVMQVTPQPDSVEVGPDRFTFVILAPDLSRPTSITFYLEPEKFGRLRGQAGLEGGQSITFSQFIYP